VSAREKRTLSMQYGSRNPYGRLGVHDPALAGSARVIMIARSVLDDSVRIRPVTQ
jgi:hypothetical protein